MYKIYILTKDDSAIEFLVFRRRIQAEIKLEQLVSQHPECDWDKSW